MEEFLPGRELSVGVLGNYDRQVFPVAEIVVTEESGDTVPFYPFEMKGTHRKELVCPAVIDAELERAVGDAALELCTVFDIRDYCRVDFKLDGAGEPHFLEINALPGLAPAYSLYPIAAREAGISYDGLIRRILDSGGARHDRAASAPAEGHAIGATADEARPPATSQLG